MKMGPKRQWLAGYSWEFVTAQNAVLCAAKNALHKPTSDGHETTKAFWENRNQDAMELTEAVEICRRCHRFAPFCFYNGNTFAAIIRDVVNGLNLEIHQHQIVRSLAGHIVAGVASDEETQAFREFCSTLE
jgi:cytolysin (calcineurin-like family phosphatase)